VLTLAIASAKGGVGKTTLAVHLAAGLARLGHRTLLVDADAQAHATRWLLGTLPEGPGTSDALLGHRPHPHQVPNREHLAVLAGGPAVAAAELRLASEVAGETLLQRALAQVADAFDYAVIDTPPATSLAVVGALVAAEAVLVPTPAAFLALAGLAQVRDTVDRVRERLGADVELLGAVLTFADAREGVTAEVRELLRRELGRTLYRAEVRISSAAKALPAHQAVAWDAGHDARGAEDYTAVVAETLTRLRTRVRTHAHTRIRTNG
jgi:chromosome partitioning protein